MSAILYVCLVYDSDLKCKFGIGSVGVLLLHYNLSG